jgi:hypothetical protein
MTDKDDLLLKSYFGEHKQTIKDNGFTEKVMRQIPIKEMQLARIWTSTCTLLAIVLFIIFKGWTIVYDIVNQLLCSIKIDHLLQISPSTLIVIGVVLMIIMIRKVCSIE